MFQIYKSSLYFYINIWFKNLKKIKNESKDRMDIKQNKIMPTMPRIQEH